MFSAGDGYHGGGTVEIVERQVRQGSASNVNDGILCCDFVAHAMALLESVESVKNVDVDS